MRLKALEVFVELGEAESFRQLARAHGVKASAISRQIEALEYYFRTELFDRNAEGITLTESGRLLLGYARTILANVREARAATDELRGLERGSVTIYAAGAPAAGILARVVADLHVQYPGLLFHIETASASNVFDAVESGKADLGLTMFSPETSKVEIRLSSYVEHKIIVAPGHPLAGEERVSLRQLASVPLVLAGASHGSRMRLNQMAREAHVMLEPVFESSSVEVHKELALRKVAALVLPVMCCQREIETGQLIALPFEERDAMITTVDLCCARGRRLSFAARKLSAAIGHALEGA
ncbi:LysR family transcriptional regulator [Nitrospirillum amazonense]|uniref:LysR family transcriptional regulator n=1 Tax=Nitrospirillum amazonense TaxID=28077 RepID=A0A560K3D1_9PROT|nr:LysR family transcriptional regulator [Nitrospirillum amazonense]MDG3444299.1 LysR family transcriptional regulator [Nitrospirillum amazonense]TWB77855.1 LysR family transcriptional regulator [Nitrospirillum amazonense]